MKQSFTIDTGRNYEATAICLPPRNFSIDRRYALISGWDEGPDLQIGPIVINEMKGYFDKPVHYLFQNRKVTGLKTCQVNYAYLDQISQKVLTK